ncbi:MAG TPA: alpha/beta hydrolase [Bacteroidales bacterium]|nr:alpha/beta hydrolase [Bacteroidales bacterium]
MNRRIDFQNHTINYAMTGKGPAIVLLHGFLETMDIWDDFASQLSDRFTVITVDLPGHGGSEVISEIHTMSLMAEVIASVLKHLGITEVVIAGHSLGGYVAGEFAMKYPAMVKGLAFFHSHAAPDTDEAKENRRRSINIVNRDHAGFLNQFIPDLFDQKYVANYREQISVLQRRASVMTANAITATIAGMRDRTGSLPYLFTTEKPVLFIIGKQDTRLSYNVVLAQALIPAHSEVLLLDDVGHMGFIEAPRQTLQVLTHFAMKCYE